jgi:hypothetical protein
VLRGNEGGNDIGVLLVSKLCRGFVSRGLGLLGRCRGTASLLLDRVNLPGREAAVDAGTWCGLNGRLVISAVKGIFIA